MKILGIDVELKPTCLSISVGRACFGVGWWVRGHWQRWSGWLAWRTEYYDGYWFGCRLGPLFYSYGPY